MKVLRISSLILMGLSLMSGICYGETTKNYYDKGLDCLMAEESKKAQQEFGKALEIDPFYVPAKACLERVEDPLK